MIGSNLYNSLSPSFQTVLISLRGLVRSLLRNNFITRKIERRISENEFSIEKLNSYRKERKSAILKAISKTKFYSKYSGQHYDSFEYLLKSDIRDNIVQITRSNLNPFIIKGHTSGTTGSPLVVYQNLHSVIREQAFINRSLRWAGYKKGDKRAWIRGDLIVPLENDKGPYHRYSIFEDMILLSSYHINHLTIPAYIEEMVKFGVSLIQAHPSSIAKIARYLKSANEKYPGKLKGIVTSSEVLSVEDKALIEEVFGCIVIDWYGQFERVAAISSCEFGHYHLLTDYSDVELVHDFDGKLEITGTSFNNTIMPLAKYKTGDYVLLEKSQTCKCNRVFPVIAAIEGRVADYVIGANGNKVHLLNNITWGMDGILSTQYVQKKADSVDINVVVNPAVYTSEIEQKLIVAAKKRFGSSMTVNVNQVDNIPLTKNGKFRQAICEV